MFRSRHCDSPYPSNGGRECPGDPVEERDCFMDTCAKAVGTFLTDWTPWSPCSEGCGPGTKVSTRRCHGSDTCTIGIGDSARQVGSLTRRAPCISLLCSLTGGWSTWSEWSLCSTVCGSGYHLKVRSCSNPLPVGLGNECSGNGYQKAACTHNSDSCTAVPRERDYGLWSTWSKCSSSCNGGVKIRNRACVDHQTLECTGPIYNIWPCNIKQHCPVDGGWSEWSAWTPCSLTCGVGRTQRYRLCASPSARHGGRECEGEAAQVKKCRTARCPALTPFWGSWGTWTDCSSSCEGGMKSRQRWCLVRKKSIRRLVRVKMTRNCAGEFQQFSVCNTLTCPVDGSWTSWSAWTVCTASCDEGVMTRDRSCTDPAPIGNGTVCGGYGSDTRHCFLRPCAKEGSVILAFDGSSFLIYRRSAHPARHLLIFLVVRPIDPHGLLLLRRDEEWTEVVVMVRLVDHRVHLYAEVGPNLQIDFTGSKVKLDLWNSLEVGIAGHEAWLRVNDGDITLYEIDGPIPENLDWDLPMYVGGALPNLFPGNFDKIGGFSGEMAKLRVNFKDYSLHQTQEWAGGGLPYVNLNVEETESEDIDPEVPTFTGEEYTTLPCLHKMNTTVITPLIISMTVRPADGEGVLVYVIGDYPGSFFMLSLRDSDLVLTMSLGHDQEVVQRKGSALESGKWSLVDITLEGFSVEVRVNKGPATQLTSIGHAHFSPSSTLYVGGVSLRERLQVAKNAAAFRGFVGEILEATINWMDYKVYEAALSTDVLINSASATVAAHFRDIHAKAGASVLLRCQYGHVVDEVDDAHRWVRAAWLYNGDRLLEFNPLRRIIPSDPSHPYSASLLLIGVQESAEGFYACQVTFRGVSIVTHAFSVTVDGEPGDGLAVDRTMDIIIVASASSFVLIALVVVLMSCCTPCRRRSYLLDLLYDSMMQCCGCQMAGALPPGLTYADLALVDASYYPDFSPRTEKARLDERLARRQHQQSARKDELREEKEEEHEESDNSEEDNENEMEDDNNEEDEKEEEDRHRGMSGRVKERRREVKKERNVEKPHDAPPESPSYQPRRQSKYRHSAERDMSSRDDEHQRRTNSVANKQLDLRDSRDMMSPNSTLPQTERIDNDEPWFSQPTPHRDIKSLPGALETRPPSVHKSMPFDVDQLPPPPAIPAPPPPALTPKVISSDLPRPYQSPINIEIRETFHSVAPPRPDVKRNNVTGVTQDNPGLLTPEDRRHSIPQNLIYQRQDHQVENSPTWLPEDNLLQAQTPHQHLPAPSLSEPPELLQLKSPPPPPPPPPSLHSTLLLSQSTHTSVPSIQATPPPPPPQSLATPVTSTQPGLSPPQPQIVHPTPPQLHQPNPPAITTLLRPTPPETQPSPTVATIIPTTLQQQQSSNEPPRIRGVENRNAGLSQDQLENHPPSVPNSSFSDISRAKLEVNRRRRMSTGARFGSRPQHLHNVNQNSSREGEAKVADGGVSLTYAVGRTEGPPTVSSDITKLPLSSGDFGSSISETGTLGLVSELMDSLQLQGSQKPGTERGEKRHIIIDTVGEFLCEDCQQACDPDGAKSLQSRGSIESNDEHYVSCGDTSS